MFQQHRNRNNRVRRERREQTHLISMFRPRHIQNMQLTLDIVNER